MAPVVAIAGSGPAAHAVAAALGDADAAIEQQTSPDIESTEFAVVVGQVGEDVFETANEQALAGSTPWIAVELGGVGGRPVARASVAGFDPERECYDCLKGRVASNVPEESEAVESPEAPTERLAGAIAGEAAVTSLTGESDALGRVIELPQAERRFLPLPGCDCAGERDLTVRRDHAETDLEATLTRAERGLDERLGVVQRVGEAESFPSPYYLAELCDTSAFSDATAPRQAAGVAADWNTAFMKGMGEAYERYAAAVYREADTCEAAAADLESAVTPDEFVRPDGATWDAEEPTEWVPAEDLATGEETHVPAELVFHPPREERIRPPLTTGLGLGSSGTEALVSGLTEVVERDAAMLSWYSTFDPLELDVGDEVFGTLTARAAAEGLEISPLLLTQDVDVPVVAVVVHREEWPSFAVGSAADLDSERAARAAAEEALQNWMELRNLGPEGAEQAGGAIGHYADMPDAAVDMLSADQTIPAAAVGDASVPDGPEELDALVERVTDAGLSAYATRTTTRDLEQIGFEGVRVLVPGAQPLFLGDSFFGKRAETVPEELGFEARLDRDHHPFP